MATTTTNLGLTKPATSDNVDITVINANMDKIDAIVDMIPREVTFERKYRTYTNITVPNVGYIKVDSYASMEVSSQKYLLSITPRGWSGHIENVTFAKSSTGADIYMIAPAGTTVSSINVEYVFSNI